MSITGFNKQIMRTEYSSALNELSESMRELGRAAAVAQLALKKIFNVPKYNFTLDTKSNNWLKLHGYPTRRKGVNCYDQVYSRKTLIVDEMHTYKQEV